MFANVPIQESFLAIKIQAKFPTQGHQNFQKVIFYSDKTCFYFFISVSSSSKSPGKYLSSVTGFTIVIK